MLRTLARASVILVVAATVAGGLYLAVGSHAASLSEERVAASAAGPFDDHIGHRRGRWEGRTSVHNGHAGREEASVGRGVAGMAGTALQIAFVGAIVVLLQKRSRRRQGR